MKVINLSETPSLISEYVSELRDSKIQGDRMRFRKNIERIGTIMSYEVSRTLEYRNRRIKTPLSEMETPKLEDKIVIGTVFRAGLPLHMGFLEAFDKADNAFVSAYRYYTDEKCSEIDVNIEYIASPDLNGVTLMLVDPMLATGESLELAWKALLTQGTPSKLHIACVIASEEGIDHLQEVFPDDEVTLWCAAIDPCLNEHRYIVPGLGDAGDLCYGPKL